MPKNIKDSATILRMLEDGDFSSDLSNELNELVAALRERSGRATAAKGSLTIVLEFTVEGISANVVASIISKLPAPPKRIGTTFYATSEGLSTEHPRQTSMDFEVHSGGKASG